MKRISVWSITCLIALGLVPAWPQTANRDQPQIPNFEVASFRRATFDGTGANMTGGPGTPDPRHLTYSKITLRMLLLNAWGIGDTHLVGPSWLDTERYTIRATIAPDLQTGQLGPMLQRLLTERLRLVFHHETRTLSAYELTVGPGGHRMTRDDKASVDEPKPWEAQLAGRGFQVPPKDADGCPVLKPGNHFSLGFWSAGISCESFTKYSMTDFAQWLRGTLPAVSGPGDVIDKTGLSGEFDFRIRFEQHQFFNRLGPAAVQQADDASGPSGAPTIFSAIDRQLGLKLKPVKIQSDVLVIDHADKDPIEN